MKGATKEFMRVLAMVTLKDKVRAALSPKKRAAVHKQYIEVLQICMKLKPSATKTRHMARIKLMLEVTNV